MIENSFESDKFMSIVIGRRNHLKSDYNLIICNTETAFDLITNA